MLNGMYLRGSDVLVGQAATCCRDDWGGATGAEATSRRWLLAARRTIEVWPMLRLRQHRTRTQ